MALNSLRPFGVLFDMDGVLVNSNPAHKQAIRRVCALYGKTISKSFFRTNISGRTNREWIPLVFTGISGDEIDRIADEKEQLFRDLFNPAEAITLGLISFLNVLNNNKIPMAVATSAPKDNADFILRELEITALFDAVLHSAHVAKGKPHPDIYIKSAHAIGLQPDQCLVLEDSVAGVTAGLKAGARVVGITGTHTHQELSACDRVISHFEEFTFSDAQDLVLGNSRVSGDTGDT